MNVLGFAESHPSVGVGSDGSVVLERSRGSEGSLCGGSGAEIPLFDLAAVRRLSRANVGRTFAHRYEDRLDCLVVSSVNGEKPLSGVYEETAKCGVYGCGGHLSGSDVAGHHYGAALIHRD